MGRDLSLERDGIGTPATTQDSKIHDATWKEPVTKEHTLHNLWNMFQREKSTGTERGMEVD